MSRYAHVNSEMEISIMMEPVKRIKGINANPVNGKIITDWPKTMWNLSMIVASIALIPFYTNWGSIGLFLVLTYFSLLIGHSVGMHRMMIHRSFHATKLVERLLIYAGVLVGMAGPFGIIKIHDLRDWAQRQSNCHNFFSHKECFIIDLWWQLTSKFQFENAPEINIEENLKHDKFYIFLERTWWFHQIPIALVLYFIGGMPFVVWGVFARISVSVVGHWSITYICHNPGPGKWLVKGASVQASNIPGLGILTYGECWHNNHHAFPESAKIGLEPGQCDPSWRFIQLLKLLGGVKSIELPRPEELREDLKQVS